ncbi:hypothetical protein EI427_08325 [Flammeovirga pectinis]|uniref:Type I restriction enzyme R protein N-terminal domain-containing protein n=1 Tax=Flammeovirga pectinis TaxID=2494373 RepID=A0A3S9P230_9BACT|nr:type I restriction enzyme HsdR N-terminal domain-containing protein [Flammeovirga pectinis]AZQ62241.1 hypothetical protein EI427_08325 [Flammeovirga pectinis]
MKWLSKGKRDGVIRVSKNKDEVTYLPHIKTRSLYNPEEQVQLATYLSLIYDHGYPAEYVRVCVPVKMGSSTKEADIITYTDEDGLDPFMIVECKKKGVPESVFHGAIDQGFSYASATLAKFVWTTDGDRNIYHEVNPQKIGERKANKMYTIPPFKGSDGFLFKLKRSTYKVVTSPLKFIKSIFKIPSVQNALIYMILLSCSFAMLSILAVEHINQIIEYTKVLWDKFRMDFSWIYYAISFISLFFTVTLGSIVKAIPSIRKQGLSLKQVLFLCLFLFLPVYLIGDYYTLSWWNWKHFRAMPYKEWIFAEPQLVIFPVQLFLFATILALAPNKRKRKRISRKKY